MVSLGSASNRSSTNVWDPQSPYLQDAYRQAGNLFYGGGQQYGQGQYGSQPGYGAQPGQMYAGGPPGPGAPPGQMYAGGSPGFNETGGGQTLYGAPPGAPPPGVAPQAAPAPPPAPVPSRPSMANFPGSDAGETQYREAVQQWDAMYGPGGTGGPPAAPTEPVAPAPGIPAGDPGFPQMPPWMQQGMQGSSQAFDSLVNATNPGNNPYFGGAVESALRPMLEQYTSNFLPQQRAGAAMAGQNRGDPRQQIERGLAQRGMANAMGDVVSNMGNNAYNQSIFASQAALQNNPYGATPWDLLSQYQNAIGPPVMESSERGSRNQVGF